MQTVVERVKEAFHVFVEREGKEPDTLLLGVISHRRFSQELVTTAVMMDPDVWVKMAKGLWPEKYMGMEIRMLADNPWTIAVGRTVEMVLCEHCLEEERKRHEL